MNFSEAVKTCFSKYATFSGRARRPEYWWFVLFVFLCGMILSVFDSMLFGADPVTGQTNGYFAGAFQLATLIPMFAVGWRRMHDAGYPGWYLLLPMVVTIAMIFTLFSGVALFAAMETTAHDPDALRGPAAFLGTTGLLAAMIVQLLLAVLILWWLTRPSQPGPNAYGEPV